ncbi:hypothetical protein COEREDRAFT_8991 [Coemansia reversa NRRL 1564]|uniref:Ribosome biogenesis protein SLX9 n=1 Tax=Coemansia reversa (strain ATCC 12441 / NRRL 1564) TaxID=763665 RepID=A0A2G5B9Q7_COERN|nr:hypothetical protein COEREDRAFT_8991 [Coemansia reversa NRRL 1564]|eukprot:PIA15748.1 hypothetical protein COEREDRAFT_8991 [Coemansia reversa NRRL 1564]
MPRVARQRTKYHAATPSNSVFSQRPTPAVESPFSSSNFFASIASTSDSIRPQASATNDIVSAAVSLEAKDEPQQSNVETKGPLPRNKKEKRVRRHQKWVEKMNAVQFAKRQQQKTKDRQSNRSALIRGMNSIQSSLREVQAEIIAKDVLAPEKDTTKTRKSSDTGKIISRKARNKAAIKEEKRFGQVLLHPDFRANPLATIQKHLANTLNTEPK